MCTRHTFWECMRSLPRHRRLQGTKRSFLVVLWQACDHDHWYQDTHSGDRLDFVPTHTPILWEPRDFCDFDTHTSHSVFTWGTELRRHPSCLSSVTHFALLIPRSVQGGRHKFWVWRGKGGIVLESTCHYVEVPIGNA